MVNDVNLEGKVELDLENVNALIKLGSLTKEMICGLRTKIFHHEKEIEATYGKYLEIKSILEKLDYLEDVRIGMKNIEKIYNEFRIDPNFNASYYWCENNLKE